MALDLKTTLECETSNQTDRPQGNLPDAWEESAQQEGAVSLHEGGEEGEDTVDGQRDEQRLPAAYPVGQRPPEEGPDHHPEIYNQTCRESRRNYTFKM